MKETARLFVPVPVSPISVEPKNFSFLDPLHDHETLIVVGYQVVAYQLAFLAGSRRAGLPAR
jgi:hypothetical protein